MQNQDAMWIEIDLDDLTYNYLQAQKMAGDKKLMPVIKADAYGHGAVMIAKALQKAGASSFAVTTAVEALALRDAGIEAPLLILGVVPPATVDVLVSRDVCLAVPSLETAQRYLEASSNRPIKIHLKVDSGMNRLGFSAEHALEDLLAIASNKNFAVDGLFTHFADSGEPSHDDYTRGQHKSFQRILDAFKARGILPPIIHCSNSDAIVRFPEFAGNTARPGIILYGYASPSPRLLPLRPSTSIRALISQLKWVEQGQGISYALTWTAPRRTLVATIAAGYADGILRSGSGKIEMLLHGKRVAQIGRVCMDMCMLDVTNVPEAATGDIVTIVGKDGGESLWMDELARSYGTIPYELMTVLSSRSPRYYLQDGKVAGVMRRNGHYSSY